MKVVKKRTYYEISAEAGYKLMFLKDGAADASRGYFTKVACRKNLSSKLIEMLEEDAKSLYEEWLRINTVEETEEDEPTDPQP